MKPVKESIAAATSVGRFAVIGNPIAHSRSPEIHQAFARQTGRSLTYERLLADPDAFEATVRRFRDEGGIGLNVTMPFKEDAFRYADRHTSRALAAGAVNTLHFTATGVLGDNTDGAGLVRDLDGRCGASLAGVRLILIGAGGAARGVMQALLNAGVARLIIANRTPARAQTLAARAVDWPRDSAQSVTAMALTDLAGLATDERRLIIINATAAAQAGGGSLVPASLLARAALAYDIGYSSGDTPFVKQAREAGCPRVFDGLGMLVEQAAESFLLWHGVHPDTDPVLARLRAAIDGASTH